MGSVAYRLGGHAGLVLVEWKYDILGEVDKIGGGLLHGEVLQRFRVEASVRG